MPLPYPDGWGLWKRLVSPQQWRVLEDVVVEIGEGDHRHKIVVPAGLVTDFASIPRLLKPFSPDSINYGTAALVHDALYKSGEVGKRVCDALLAGLILDCNEGNSVQAELVFLGVHFFGGFAWMKHRANQNQ